MAIYHCSVKIISRSTGRSSVAAAAYRSGEKLYNDREGIEHDFSRKRGVEHSEIMLSENAPAEYQSRETLWNAVERAERRKDAQTAREIEVALPVEFNRQEQMEVLREYVRENFTSRGMCADICVHDKGDGNPHAHIMLTTREVTPDGFGGKCREWNDKRNVEDWRQGWAAACNRQFERKNLPDRLDHRSFERQGKVQLPTIHLGANATAMEKRGERTERGRYNEEVRVANMEYQDSVEKLQQEIAQLKQQAQEMAATQKTQQEKREQQAEEEHKKQEQQAEEERRKREQPTDRREAADQLRENEIRHRTRRTVFLDEQTQRPGIVLGTDDQNSAGETTEQIVRRLDSLKTEYIQLEVRIDQAQRKAEELYSTDRRLHSRAESIQETSQTIEQYSRKISQLRAEREQLGLFKGKQKKALDEQMNRLEVSKAQAQDSLQRACGAAGQAATLQQIQQQQAEIWGQLSRLPDTDKLKEQQAAIEQEYRRDVAAAMQRSDWKQIEEQHSGKAGQPENERGGKRSMKERLAEAKAESRLQNKHKQRPSRGREMGGR